MNQTMIQVCQDTLRESVPHPRDVDDDIDVCIQICHNVFTKFILKDLMDPVLSKEEIEEELERLAYYKGRAVEYYKWAEQRKLACVSAMYDAIQENCEFGFTAMVNAGLKALEPLLNALNANSSL